MCDPIAVVNSELQRPPSLNLLNRINNLAFLTPLGIIGNEVVPIRGHGSGGKSVNSYPVGVSVKSNGAWTVIGLSDGACVSTEHWCVTSTPDTEAIIVNDCRNAHRCEELCTPVTPPFRPSGDAKRGKEERHGSFWSMILWNYIRRLVLKMTESERIDAPAGPLTIVAFLAAVPTVVSRENSWGVCAT